MAENTRLRTSSIQPVGTLDFTFFSYSAPFGPVWIATVSGSICYISLVDDQERFLAFFRKKTGYLPPNQSSQIIRQSFDRYFNKDRAALEELNTVFLWGTDFQQRVWRTLKEIPCGQTWSYAKLAKKVNSPKGGRPVGSANSANPLPLIFPCHRVIKSDGSLGGFMGNHRRGKEIKKFLLDLP